MAVRGWALRNKKGKKYRSEGRHVPGDPLPLDMKDTWDLLKEWGPSEWLSPLTGLKDFPRGWWAGKEGERG